LAAAEAGPVRAARFAGAGAAFLPALLLLWLVLRATGGQFTYTLDDPYIHLGLARAIAHGHYGLNPGELSAPSSSILWPFLLAPFAALPERAFELVPLALNLACLGASLVVMLRLLPQPLPRWWAATATALLALMLNLYGLVFTGMEHSLQLLLVLVALDGFFARPPDGSARPARFYAALALLPLVRYEGLALSAALLGYQFLRGDRRNTVLAGGVALAGIIGFSLFLHAQGLGWLPSSVLAKATADNGQWPIVARFRLNLHNHPLLLLGVVAGLWRIARRDPLLATALSGMTLLHLAFGQFGWSGRYEVYWLAAIVIVVLREPGLARPLGLLPILAFLALASNLRNSTLDTPGQAGTILAQQGQMDRIAALLDAPVAANDIGLLTLHARHYVLDLWGLASPDTLALRKASPGDAAWAGAAMRRHGVRHAMIYADWFPHLPGDWIAVGTLALAGDRHALGGAVVTFYATDPAAAERLRAALALYRNCCAIPQAVVRIGPATR